MTNKPEPNTRAPSHLSPLERAKASYQPMQSVDRLVGLEREPNTRAGEVLKPCPCCQSTRIIGKDDGSPIYCKDCHLRGADLARWNTRPLPQPSELVEDRATYATAIRDTVAGFEPAAMARFGGAFLDCAKEIEQLEAQIAKLQADGNKLAGALARSRTGWANVLELGLLPVTHEDTALDLGMEATQALDEWKDRA